MTFAVSGTKAATSSGSIRMTELVLYDTEEEAMKEAENWASRRYEEVAVWKQLGMPKLKTSIEWERAHD